LWFDHQKITFKRCFYVPGQFIFHLSNAFTRQIWIFIDASFSIEIYVMILNVLTVTRRLYDYLSINITLGVIRCVMARIPTHTHMTHIVWRSIRIFILLLLLDFFCALRQIGFLEIIFYFTISFPTHKSLTYNMCLSISAH
jgi:hypothetical protein